MRPPQRTPLSSSCPLPPLIPPLLLDPLVSGSGSHAGPRPPPLGADGRPGLPPPASSSLFASCSFPCCCSDPFVAFVRLTAKSRSCSRGLAAPPPRQHHEGAQCAARCATQCLPPAARCRSHVRPACHAPLLFSLRYQNRTLATPPRTSGPRSRPPAPAWDQTLPCTACHDADSHPPFHCTPSCHLSKRPLTRLVHATRVISSHQSVPFSHRYAHEWSWLQHHQGPLHPPLPACSM